MRFLDVLLGRTKRKQANLDALFALPGAAVGLEAELGLRPAGAAGVCFRPSSGQVFAETEGEIRDLLAMSAKESGAEFAHSADAYGYQWVTVRDPDLEDLVTAVHLVNATLEERGFGPQLLASVFAFAADARVAYLIYLYKRGTFYPFVPSGEEQRDNQAELQLRGALSEDLPIEQDLQRWFPIWGVPVP
ncbi:MAG: hypothetical protein M3252_02970 [Actinomycetota bacterium]|nr:hypothetical protein [Actinomycetota bacterium]